MRLYYELQYTSKQLHFLEQVHSNTRFGTATSVEETYICGVMECGEQDGLVVAVATYSENVAMPVLQP